MYAVLIILICTLITDNDIENNRLSLFVSIPQAPLYHLAIEGLLLIWVVWLLLRKPTPKKPKLTQKVHKLILIQILKHFLIIKVNRRGKS
jgi:hypothetical protein